MLITARVRVTKHAGANHIGGFKPGYLAQDIGGEYPRLWPATILPPRRTPVRPQQAASRGVVDSGLKRVTARPRQG